MGSLLSKLIGSFVGNQPCESFLKDFPNNVGKLSLPSVVLDGLGLTCSGGNRSGPLINFAGNVTSLIMLYIGNRNVGFLKSLGKMIPKLFTSDEATNATIAEYLVINIVLFSLTLSSPVGRVSTMPKHQERQCRTACQTSCSAQRMPSPTSVS
jgi:hypothetical protein